MKRRNHWPLPPGSPFGEAGTIVKGRGHGVDVGAANATTGRRSAAGAKPVGQMDGGWLKGVTGLSDGVKGERTTPIHEVPVSVDAKQRESNNKTGPRGGWVSMPIEGTKGATRG